MISNKEKPKKKAFTAAIEMISRRDYSKNRLTEKLQKKGYETEDIENATNRLEELGYLDDKEVLKSELQFLCSESKKSLREIKYKLIQRGFKSEDIEDAIPEKNEERELLAALKTLKIKYYRNKEPVKMRAYLYRRGFSTDICYGAVEKFLNEDETDL